MVSARLGSPYAGRLIAEKGQKLGSDLRSPQVDAENKGLTPLHRPQQPPANVGLSGPCKSQIASAPSAPSHSTGLSVSTDAVSAPPRSERLYGFEKRHLQIRPLLEDNLLREVLRRLAHRLPQALAAAGLTSGSA